MKKFVDYSNKRLIEDIAKIIVDNKLNLNEVLEQTPWDNMGLSSDEKGVSPKQQLYKAQLSLHDTIEALKAVAEDVAKFGETPMGAKIHNWSKVAFSYLMKMYHSVDEQLKAKMGETK